MHYVQELNKKAVQSLSFYAEVQQVKLFAEDSSQNLYILSHIIESQCVPNNINSQASTPCQLFQLQKFWVSDRWRYWNVEHTKRT